MCQGRAHPAFSALNRWVVLTQLKEEFGCVHMQIIIFTHLLLLQIMQGRV